MEQWERNGSGEAIATELAGIVRSLDDTRPVTAACNDPMPHNPVIASGARTRDLGGDVGTQDFAKKVVAAI